MILSFKHKGLEKFFTKGSKQGIQPAHATKLGLILAALNVAAKAGDMNRNGWGFHSLKPVSANVFAVSVNGNWRVTFLFQKSDAEDVDYLDYH